MNQRIGMYHLDRCHKRLDHLHILTAKKPVGFPHQDRTDSLATRHQTVFHRIKYRLLESLPVRKIPGQYLLCLLLSFLKFFFKSLFMIKPCLPATRRFRSRCICKFFCYSSPFSNTISFFSTRSIELLQFLISFMPSSYFLKESSSVISPFSSSAMIVSSCSKDSSNMIFFAIIHYYSFLSPPTFRRRPALLSDLVHRDICLSIRKGQRQMLSLLKTLNGINMITRLVCCIGVSALQLLKRR